MEIAKALILAGRVRGDSPRVASLGPGHLFPVANRPILLHNLEGLRAAGVLEATILADRDEFVAIRRTLAAGSELGVRVRYEEWDPCAGIAGALVAGRDFLADEPILVQNAAALLRDRMHGHITAFAREQLDALALRLAHPDSRRARGDTPGYLLSPRAVAILLAGGNPTANPVTSVRAGGGRVRIARVEGCLPSDGDHAQLLESNRRALEKLEASVDPGSLEECSIQGPVVVHPSARVSRALLRGPAIIGPGARISDAYIGPYTSIGADVVIDGAEIEYSIVLPEAELRHIGTRLESSVIGRRARIARGFGLPGAIRVAVGDGAEVILR